MIKLILPLILIVGIIGGVYLVQQKVNPFTKASGEAFEDRITISNISPTSFVITYFTKAPSSDYILYGTESNISKTAMDVRDNAGVSPKRNTHYFYLKDLKPNTKYLFKINSDSNFYPTNSYLTQQTPAVISEIPGTEVFKGTVKTQDKDEAPYEGIVFIGTDKGQLLSTVAQKNGDWFIRFRGLRSRDLSSFTNISQTDQVQFMAYAAKGGFGMYRSYALKKAGIDIKLTEDTLPFFKINVNEASISAQKQSGNILWIKIKDLFKF